VAEPNKDVGGIGPKKRTNSPGYLYRFVDLEALQSLNIKNPIVETALGAFVSVNTFPLTKHLFAHMDSPFPRAASREIMNRFRLCRELFSCEFEPG
jgi:hypothetical protein